VADILPTWGGWATAIRDNPFGHFVQARARCPVQRVRLADGHLAWVVLGRDAARHALSDSRLSKDMLAALKDNGDVVRACPGRSSRGTCSTSTRPTTPGCGGWSPKPSCRPE
jgi:hypothetical protein